ncbi:UNVERIFIED_CONTAM: hypothetical protein ABIC26_004816 [Paenibacillus sp. PvR008]
MRDNLRPYLIHALTKVIQSDRYLHPLWISFHEVNICYFTEDSAFAAYISRYFELGLPDSDIFAAGRSAASEYTVIHTSSRELYAFLALYMQDEGERCDIDDGIEILAEQQDIGAEQVNVLYVHFSRCNRVVVLTDGSDSGDTEHQARVCSMRLLRALVKVVHLKRGWTLFHAAACQLGDTGIGIVGDKRAGKTSTLLSLLTSEHAHFISNDKVLLQERTGALHVLGLPHKVGIRKQTLLRFPGLQAKILQAGTTLYYEQNRQVSSPGYVSPNETKEPKIMLLPKEIAALSDTQIQYEGRIHLWVILIWRIELAQVEGRRLTSEEAASILVNQQLQLEGTERILDDCLNPGQMHRRRCKLEQDIRQAIAGCRIYLLYQNASILGEASQMIRSWVEQFEKRDA